MVYMAILSKVAGPLENIVMHQSVYFIIQFKKKKKHSTTLDKNIVWIVLVFVKLNIFHLNIYQCKVRWSLMIIKYPQRYKDVHFSIL